MVAFSIFDLVVSLVSTSMVSAGYVIVAESCAIEGLTVRDGQVIGYTYFSVLCLEV